MVLVVGMCMGPIMDCGSHVCLGILFSDRTALLNYQSSCLSTLFAWILISLNSVLTPSGECVGDVERKCVCVCMREREREKELHVRSTLSDMGLSVWNAEHADLCAMLRWWCHVHVGMQRRTCGPVTHGHVQVVTALLSTPAASHVWECQANIGISARKS